MSDDGYFLFENLLTPLTLNLILCSFNIHIFCYYLCLLLIFGRIFWHVDDGTILLILKKLSPLQYSVLFA